MLLSRLRRRQVAGKRLRHALDQRHHVRMLLGLRNMSARPGGARDDRSRSAIPAGVSGGPVGASRDAAIAQRIHGGLGWSES
jgi:hypothetical protein